MGVLSFSEKLRRIEECGTARADDQLSRNLLHAYTACLGRWRAGYDGLACIIANAWFDGKDGELDWVIKSAAQGVRTC